MDEAARSIKRTQRGMQLLFNQIYPSFRWSVRGIQAAFERRLLGRYDLVADFNLLINEFGLVRAIVPSVLMSQHMQLRRPADFKALYIRQLSVVGHHEVISIQRRPHIASFRCTSCCRLRDVASSPLVRGCVSCNQFSRASRASWSMPRSKAWL